MSVANNERFVNTLPSAPPDYDFVLRKSTSICFRNTNRITHLGRMGILVIVGARLTDAPLLNIEAGDFGVALAANV